MSDDGTGTTGNRRAQRAEVVSEMHALIKEAAQEIRGSDFGLVGQAGAIRDLALAFRYIDGGAQPGSGVVER